MNIVKTLVAGLIALTLSGCIGTNQAIFPIYGKDFPQWKSALLTCTGRYAEQGRVYTLVKSATTPAGTRYTFSDGQERVMNIAFIPTRGNKYIVTSREEGIYIFLFANVGSDTILVRSASVEAAKAIAAQHQVTVQANELGEMKFGGSSINIGIVLQALAEQDQFQTEPAFSCTRK